MHGKIYSLKIGKLMKVSKVKIRLKTVVVLILIFVGVVKSQQIDIPRIELIQPNLPSPYIMRDWKTVAEEYDAFVFDQTKEGEYLPLVSLYNNTVNYPHGSFKLHTVVGTPHPGAGEGINCLPAVIGASLVGIDKSDQDGNNWVLWCEEWFNKRPAQNVYKNHPVADDYNDWWYTTMPNVFFYQLYDLYPNTGDFAYQFTTVADQWLRAVEALGGNDA
ncbi:laminin G, partial [Bacteroidota bacterium]